MNQVSIFYNASMLPYFNKAVNQFHEEGISIEGISWKVQGNKLVVTITMKQKESFLLSLGIRIGKAFEKDNQPKTSNYGQQTV